MNLLNDWTNIQISLQLTVIFENTTLFETFVITASNKQFEIWKHKAGY